MSPDSLVLIAMFVSFFAGGNFIIVVERIKRNEDISYINSAGLVGGIISMLGVFLLLLI